MLLRAARCTGQVWVAFSMFLGSATQTVKEHFRLEPHLSAINAAIRDLRSLQASQCAR